MPERSTRTQRSASAGRGNERGDGRMLRARAAAGGERTAAAPEPAIAPVLGRRVSLLEALAALPTPSDAALDLARQLPDWDLDSALRIALEQAGIRGAPDLPAYRQALYEESRRRLFPERFAMPSPEVQRVAETFFPLAPVALAARARRPGDDAIVARLPFEPLSEADIATWPSGEQYRRMLVYLEQDGLLAGCAMAQDWLGFSIADHILGVTGLVLWIGRQLAGRVPVDLPLLHGGAIGHDVGKFGCIGEEERRIPRLHYWYTDQWYRVRGLSGLGHIATDHSCWDLERIRLPLESQLLIYADFRTKEVASASGEPRMSIIPLRDSFAAIRDKLENLDHAKLQRYKNVYRKLRDLEDYLLHLGIDLDPPGFPPSGREAPQLPPQLDVPAVLGGRERPETVALATGRRVSTTARLFTTAHNLGVMERLRDVPALGALIEEARMSPGGRDLRTYVRILGEYAAALSHEQKEQTLDFLFELLAHPEDDVRYGVANRIGGILALGEDFWRKDLPPGVVAAGGEWTEHQLDRVLGLLDRAGPEAEDDMALTERVVYAIPVVLRRFARDADPAQRGPALARVGARLAERIHDHRPLVGLYVCEAMELLLPYLAEETKLRLPEMALAWAHHEVDNTRLMAWRLLVLLSREAERQPALLTEVQYCAQVLSERVVPGARIADLFLLEELARRTGLPRVAERSREFMERDRTPMREVMLGNLKTSTGWVEKKVNADFLVAAVEARRAAGQDPESLFAAEVAAHLANVLRVSRVEGARFHAGRCMLRLVPSLSVPQRNDLMIELLRSLQLDVEAITQYIPRFLAAILAGLPDQELDEALDDVESNLWRGNETLQRLLLVTMGWVIVHLPTDRLRGKRLRRLSGMLLGALVETRQAIVHEGYARISMVLRRLSRTRRDDGALELFARLVTKPLLARLQHAAGDRVRFFLIASALNHLDRALGAAQVRFPEHPSVAFLPGTFDPFTRAHSEIAVRVLEQVDELLVQVDDYSWRKHAQPRSLRKTLAAMALGPVPEAYPSPIGPPVHLASPTSLAKLRRHVAGRELWLVVGIDVLENASAYRDPSSPTYDIPHLVILRESHASTRWQEKLGWFRSRVQVASVSSRVRSVSSTSLRSTLDRGGDLEPHCDPLVARTLHEWRLYRSDPAHKQNVRPPAHTLIVAREEAGSPAPLAPVVTAATNPSAGARAEMERLLLTATTSGAALAALEWRRVQAAELALELRDPALASALPEDLLGSGALVESFAGASGDAVSSWRVLLAAALLRWLDRDLLFTLVPWPDAPAVALRQALEECGAALLPAPPPAAAWAAIRLDRPLLLLEDLEQALQPEYGDHPSVAALLAAGRRTLTRHLCGLASCTGVLHVNERELKRLVVAWARERLAASRGQRSWVVLGLGRRFQRDVVGTTPTVAVDLERRLFSDGSEAGLHPSRGGTPLVLQMRTAREFGGDALLLVPFLEDETSVIQVQEAASAAGLRIREVLVGITSARARATLQHLGVPLRCRAVVPRWRCIVRESALVPYVGGWTLLDQEPTVVGSLRPSLNDCLPYRHPPLEFEGEAALGFSRVALENASVLWRHLEALFRERNGRALELAELGSVVRRPRIPPFRRGTEPPAGRRPSDLLADDLEALARLRPRPGTPGRHSGGEP